MTSILFTIEDVTVAYGGRTILDRVSATLGPGPVAIMGPSGSGKSTLLRVMAGHQEPKSGGVLLGSEQVSTVSWRAASDYRIAFVHQDYRLVPFLNVTENLILAAEARGIDVSTDSAAAALGRVGLNGDHSLRLPETLSGGEQQRVAIARALVCEAAALVADEPTGALDRDNTRVVAEVLLSLAHENDLMVVVATHDPIVAEMMPDRRYLLDGRLKETPE